MEPITIDAEHRYWRGRQRLPGFSQIIYEMGFPSNPFWTADGRDEGTALAQWISFLATSPFPSENQPDQRIAGRVDGFRKFIKETHFTCADSEKIQYEPTLGYCCIPDLWGYFGQRKAVVECKRGARMKRHRLQTAAQSLALAHSWPVEDRYALYLKDGGYSLELHDDDEDFEAWRAIVAAYWTKEAYQK